ncbi:MAG: hypothetical protein M3157_01815, partial [Actinomycetota bacterium]|nr:hypothetical protein [Actinomycetota bacterium]
MRERTYPGRERVDRTGGRGVVKPSLLETHHSGRKRDLTKRYIFSKRPLYRRRRRLTLLALCAPLVLVALWVFISPSSEEASTEVVVGPVAKVSTPAISKAPEMIADLEARKQPAYEGMTSGRRASADSSKEKPGKQTAPPPPDDPTLYLTVPRLELYGHTVRNDDSQWALDEG